MGNDKDTTEDNLASGSQGDGTQNADQDTAIEKVSAVRLSAFIRTKPNMWFVQIEAIFAGRKIVRNATKFTEVIRNLEPDVLLSLEDFFDLPTEQITYANLKARLIEEFTQSEVRRMQVLLQDLALDDKKPSILYREMASLAGKNVSEEFLKNMWTQRLPRQMQSILSVFQGKTDEMLKLADRIAEVNQGHPQSIAAFTPRRDNSSSRSKPDQRDKTPSRLESLMIKMLDQIGELTRSIEKNQPPLTKHE